MKAQGYITANRKKILEYLKENENCTKTVEDIAEYMKSQNCEVNITTIYRYLDKLTNDHVVNKYMAEKGKQATFQFVEAGRKCEEHLHLQCVSCGKIIHLECEFMNMFSEHIEKEHGFQIQCNKSIIYGLCEACRKKNTKNEK